MGFIGLKTNEIEESEIKELEALLIKLDPEHNIIDRSKAIKEAVRIALFHMKNTYFHAKGLTTPPKREMAEPKTRVLERVRSCDISLDGTRKK